MECSRRQFARTVLAGISAARIAPAAVSLRHSRPAAEFARRRRPDRHERAVQLRQPRHGRRRSAEALRDARHQRHRAALAAGGIVSRPARGERPAGGRRAAAAVAPDRAAGSRRRRSAGNTRTPGVRISILKFDGIYAMSDDRNSTTPSTWRAARGAARSRAKSTCRRPSGSASSPKGTNDGRATTATRPPRPPTGRRPSPPRTTAPTSTSDTFSPATTPRPFPFSSEYHDRVTHVHVKDRKLNDGPNVPFGEGDTPIVEALRLIRDRKWPIQATIEFEYPVPPGSTRMAETDPLHRVLPARAADVTAAGRHAMPFIHDDFLLETQAARDLYHRHAAPPADLRLPLPPAAARHRREPAVREPVRDLAGGRPLQMARDARQRRARALLHRRRADPTRSSGLGGHRAPAACATRSTTGPTWS